MEGHHISSVSFEGVKQAWQEPQGSYFPQPQNAVLQTEVQHIHNGYHTNSLPQNVSNVTQEHQAFYSEDDDPELVAPLRIRKSLVMRDILEDTRDYWGIFYLFVFLVYFIYTIVFIGSNWSENGAVFHAEVMKHVSSFNGLDLEDTTNMFDAFKYGAGYVSSLVESAQKRKLPDTELYLGQYTRIKLIRLVVDVDSSCKFGTLHCHLASKELERFGRVRPNSTAMAPLPSGLWFPLPEPPYFVYGTAPYYYLTVFNVTQNSTSFENTKALIAKTLDGDAAFVGRYAIALQLEIVAEYDQQYENDTRVFFGVEWILKNMMFDSKLTGFEFKKTTKTVPLKTSFVHTGSDLARLILLVIYIIWICAYLARQVDEVRLCVRQYRLQAIVSYVKSRTRSGPKTDVQAQLMRLYNDNLLAQSYTSTSNNTQKKLSKLENEVKKATFAGVWRYCTGGWNVVDIISSLVSFLWAAGWLWVILTAAFNSHRFRFFLTKPLEDYHALLNFSWTYNSFIFIGILNCLLVGIRLYKYMQFHGGLRVYYSLLRNAWRSIKDFAFWFIYVMMVFGSTVIMVFQISGGNERFSLRWLGINSMALVTFGYMDYETFINQTAGVGGWGPIVIAIFWLAVAILSTVALNILIAIVGSAYEEAKDKEGPVEFTFVYLTWLRLVWSIIYVRRIWFSWWTEEQLARYWISIVINEINTDPLSATHDFRTCKDNAWFTMRTSRLFARWGLALLPEVKTLLTYYSDASNTMLCNRSPWEDGEAVEEMLTDMNCHKKRKKVEPPNHEWTIDSAMSQGQFMVYMLAFASSGSCGLPQGHGDDGIRDVFLPSDGIVKDVESQVQPLEDGYVWKLLPLTNNQFKILADIKFPEQLAKAEADWLGKCPALYDAYYKGTQNSSLWHAEVQAYAATNINGEEAQLHASKAKPAAKAKAAPFDQHETAAEFLHCQALAPLNEVICPRKTAGLQILESFRELGMLGSSKRLRWSQEKILRLGTWIWAVYATEQLSDEDWSADMEDVDFKLLELKEWFASEMEKKYSLAKPSTLSSRPSAVSRSANRYEYGK